MDGLSKEEMVSKRSLLQKIKKAEQEARKKAIKNRDRFFGLQILPTVSIYDDHDKHVTGENNWKKYGLDIHPQVTFFSVAILMTFIVLTMMYQTESKEFFSSLLSTITRGAGWFFILVANLYVIAALYFAFGRFGNIRIGGKNAMPEFSTPAWFAMLLSAGMGIGLMFWSVGEPMFHYASPSPMFSSVLAQTPESAQAALTVTFFHWGLHPWAIYALVGLGLAFFTYNRGLPLTIRSIFYPILGNKIYGFWGNLIDTLSVLATMIGIATSLGLGVKQINAGLNFLFDITISTEIQVMLIAIITAIATVSVFTGLDRGVKYLSSANMYLAAIFMAFVIIIGPTSYILGAFTQSLGFYITELPEMSFWTETFKGTDWQQSWTIFYWAWWISWSPFVGMFIARISKGRTVKEFIFGVILIPTLLSFLWMSVFGSAALYAQMHDGVNLVVAVKEDVSTGMFVFLKSYPFAEVSSFIAIILVAVFFVTSSDSGSLVIDHLTSGGKLTSPTAQRIFWAILEGVIAAVLLLGGGLSTLQSVAISTALPFAIVILFIIYALYVGFSEEQYIEDSVSDRIEEVEQEHFIEEIIGNTVIDESLEVNT
ncbi:MAG: choline/carnitine/betaine transport [Sulfurimonas sp.]|jgi:choline/carnitine/betaine transport|uniref:BCCT family transporter n=1 Tax=Sulfurimonas sp. TaxID=2022749 RepID=UPI0039E53BBD